MFLLSGQFKTHPQTTGLVKLKRKYCESQTTRLSCPGHTTPSAHLLTDEETETTDCVQHGQGPPITRGHRQRAAAAEAVSHQPSDLSLHSHKAQGHPYQACLHSLLLARSSQAAGNSA